MKTIKEAKDAALFLKQAAEEVETLLSKRRQLRHHINRYNIDPKSLGVSLRVGKNGYFDLYNIPSEAAINCAFELVMTAMDSKLAQLTEEFEIDLEVDKCV